MIAEVPIPKAVLISASEIPIDNAAASGVPTSSTKSLERSNHPDYSS